MIVDLTLSEDQQMIEDSVSGLLARALPVERLREESAFGGTAERSVWADFAELGLFGLGLAEADGGIGFGLAEEVIAARALGRHLVSPSVIATMIAVHLAAATGQSDAQAALASGEARAAFANPIGGGEAQLIDAEGAEWIVAISRDGLRLLTASALGDAREASSMDEALALRHATLPDGTWIADGVSERASLLLSAYLVGNAGATRDMSVEYAKTREQFGQPIGGFQAIKHACADMAVRAAAADTQTCHAAVTAGHGEAAAREAAMARLLASDAALTNAKANVQIHGGMGFTFECDAHFFLKRAHVITTLGSDRRSEQDRVLA